LRLQRYFLGTLRASLWPQAGEGQEKIRRVKFKIKIKRSHSIAGCDLSLAEVVGCDGIFSYKYTVFVHNYIAR
jgi:hypothetical protein